MKVVLFCGGYGMRMRDGVSTAPKPMSIIGDRPLLWHVMRYYAHFGHNEFILCLGHGAQYVKDYFLTYEETSSNDFILTGGGNSVELLDSDISDWSITFVNTGLNSTIGDRLRRIRRYLGDDPVFLANYADVLTDAPLPEVIDTFVASGAVACLLAVPPQSSFHVVKIGDDDLITDIAAVSTFPLWENGGYFVLRREVFDVLDEGDDLVGDAFSRLAVAGRMLAYQYEGFWQSADTLKERAQLEALFQDGSRPWAVWDDDRSAPGRYGGRERRAKDRRNGLWPPERKLR